MKVFLHTVLVLFSCFYASAQVSDRLVTLQSVLSHNDYQKEKPFDLAYQYQVGVIEVDLMVDQGEVFVAHDRGELKFKRKFEEMYLDRLSHIMAENKGPYPGTEKSLAIMFDIKNDRKTVMEWILGLVEEHPDIFGGRDERPRKIQVVISGQRPDIEDWAGLPSAIYLDGRLNDNIPVELRSKVFMISSSYSVIGHWDGKGERPEKEEQRLKNVVQQVHDQNLKLRFWGNADVPTLWEMLLEHKVDILGTDQVDELANYLRHH